MECWAFRPTPQRSSKSRTLLGTGRRTSRSRSSARDQERGFESTAAGDIAGATSIQINRNFEGRLHVDGNNLGPSDIRAPGNWQTGGELWVEAAPGEAADSERDLVLKSGRLSAAARTPGICHGRHVNVHREFFQFDGSLQLHMAMPIEHGGERFTLI